MPVAPPRDNSADVILAILEECATIDGHPFRSTGVLIQDLANHGLVSIDDGWVVTTAKGKSAIRTLRKVIKERSELKEESVH